MAKTKQGASALSTKERLLEAAATTFNSDGYHGTDTNRIARAAGFAPGTFYKHFTDKREIFLLVYAQWVHSEWQQIQATWREKAKPTTKSGTDKRAGRTVTLIVEHHRRWAGMRRSLRALCDTDEHVRTFRNEQRQEQLQFVRELRGLDGTAPNRDSAPTRARDLCTLLTFERVCDAIADGEADALGASERQLRLQLTKILTQL